MTWAAWWLVILASGNGGNGYPVALEKVPFTTIERCNEAARAVKRDFAESGATISTTCVPGGGRPE